MKRSPNQLLKNQCLSQLRFKIMRRHIAEMSFKRTLWKIRLPSPKPQSFWRTAWSSRQSPSLALKRKAWSWKLQKGQRFFHHKMLRHHKIRSCWLLALRPQCQRLKTKDFTQKLEYQAHHKWDRKHQLWREPNCRTFTVRANLQRNRSRHTPNSCLCLCRHQPRSKFKCRICLTSNSVKPWAKHNN